MGKLGKIDFVQSAVAKIAQSRPSGQARPILPVVPMEKRVLMDAVLDWHIAGYNDTSVLIAGINHLIDTQMDNLDNFLDHFHDQSAAVLGGLDAFGADHTVNDAHLTDMMDRMRDTITQMRNGASGVLGGLVGGGNLNFDTDLETAVQTALKAGLTDHSQDSTIDTLITAAQMRTAFGLTAFQDNTISGNVDALVTTLHSTLSPLGIDDTFAKAAIQVTADQYFASKLGGDYSIHLTDAKDGIDTLVGFTQHGTDRTALTVTVALPAFELDLTQLTKAGLNGASLPITYNSVAGNLSFDLGTYVTPAALNLSEMGLNIDNFDSDPLFQFSPTIGTTGGTVDMGLLSLTLSSVDAATLRGDIAFESQLDVGGKIEVGYATTSFDTTPTTTMALQIDAAGDHAHSFVNVAEGFRYNLVSVDLTGSLDVFATAAAATSDARAFTGTLTLSNVIDSSVPVNQVEAIRYFALDSKQEFSVQMNGMTGAAATTLSTMVESLAVLGIDQIAGFLDSYGKILADVLDGLTANTDVAFTDLQIHDAIKGITAALTGISTNFLIPTADLGYAENTPTQQDITAAVPYMISDVIDVDTLYGRLDGFAGLRFQVVTITPSTTAGGADTITREAVTISLANATWDDTGATDAARLAALVGMFNTGLGSKGFTFSVVNGAIKVELDQTTYRGRSLAVLGGTQNAGSVAGTVLNGSIDLASLGFSASTYTEVQGIVTPSVYQGAVALDKGTIDTFTMTDLSSLSTGLQSVATFKVSVSMGDTTKDFEVAQPADGWTTGGNANVLGFVTSLNAALTANGVPVTALYMTFPSSKIAFSLTSSAVADVTLSFDALPVAEQILALTDPNLASFTPGANFVSATDGVATLRYVVTVDGETTEILIDKPQFGWGNGTTPNMVGLVDSFNDAFTAYKLPLTATRDGAKIIFAADVGTEETITFGVDPEKLTRAHDLNSLMSWVNTKLSQAPLLDGVALKLTADGQFLFDLPSIENTVHVAPTDALAGFAASGLAVGDLNNVTLVAKLNADLHAKLDAVGGFDLVGFANDIIGNQSMGLREASIRAQAAAVAAADAATIAARLIDPEADAVTPEDVLLTKLLKNTHVQSLDLVADVQATASGITGTAQLGLMDLTIGGMVLGDNRLGLSASTSAHFKGDTALATLIMAVTYQNAAGEYDAATGLSSLIDTVAFEGRILTNGQGRAVNAAGDLVSSTNLEYVDPSSVLSSGQHRSMLYVGLNDITLNSQGITGLESEFVQSMALVVDNLADPSATLSYDIVGSNGDTVRALANLGRLDLLDSFAGIANILQNIGGELARKLPFLTESLPMLGLSFADSVDFATEFKDALQALRADSSLSLNQADQVIEKYFGNDSVSLTWDGDHKTLMVVLDLDFLKTYAQRVGLTVDLRAMLGDALNDMVGTDINRLADKGGDGKLTFDPELALNLTFGIDLSQTIQTGSLANRGTLLNDLGTVGLVVQSNKGAADILIRWQDSTLGQDKSIRIDIDGARTLGDLVTKIHTALQTDFSTSVRFVFNESTGQITLYDYNGTNEGHNVSFSLTELGGSNALRLLGITQVNELIAGTVTSQALHQGGAGAPRVFLDTAASGLRLEMTAGAADGLNLKLGLGPLTVSVVDGTALLTDGNGGTAFVDLGFVDGDGLVDGQYDLGDLFAIANDTTRHLSDLLSVDMGIGVDLDLKFQDANGLFNPAEDHLIYHGDLVTTTGAPVALLGLTDISTAFQGDLLKLHANETLGSVVDLHLPDVTGFLESSDEDAGVKDPAGVLDGLDMIMDRLQQMFDDYLGSIKLPILGDILSTSVTFFNDFRNNIIQKGIVYAQTPKEDGTMPNSVDLLTFWVNDALNALFGTNDVKFVQAFLETDVRGRGYLYGTINFAAVIFDEDLDLQMDLGIPGFNLDVEEGSKINLKLGYSVNLGFGMNRNGFFVLNDLDRNEIGLNFVADAGNFQGSMKLMNLLGVKADAVNVVKGGFDADGLPKLGGAVTGQGAAAGTLKVTAELGAALYGDYGLQVIPPLMDDGTADIAAPGEILLDLSKLDMVNGTGEELVFERLAYLADIDSSDLIAFSFIAEVEVQLGLEANILDPTTGQPLKINGSAVIPTVKTEFAFMASYDSRHHEDGVVIEHLGFYNVRVDANMIYEAILKPVIDPIKAFIDPLADALSWMNDAPFKYLKNILANAFPIFGMITSITDTISEIDHFVDTLTATGGEFRFGNFIFAAMPENGSRLEARLALSNGERDGQTTTGSTGNPFGVFGNYQRGFSIEIPLLSDPFSAINLLLGKFDQVDLIKVHATLFNLVLPRTDIVGMVLGQVSAPGWVTKIIRKIFEASVEARLIMKFSMGYDLSGIVNFVNTLDPERLLDGVFFDSAPGSLVDIFFGFRFKLDAGIAGISGGAHGGVQLSFNDPNDDGKLRIPELLQIFDAIAGDPDKFMGYLFKGQFDYGANLKVWAGISLPWPLPDLKFNVTVFDFGDTIPFGGFTLPAMISDKVATGETAILNVGARAGGNMTSMDKDGNDRITVRGPNSPIQVGVNNEYGAITGEFNQDAGGLIIPAGEGNNTIDLSGLTFGKPTVVYTGGGTDTIVLPNSGLNVIFAGAGTDTITQTGESTGTYVIFGGGGADRVNIQNGNVIYFGDSDFGMRDRFMTTFANGGLSDAAVRAMLGLNADGTVGSGGQYQGAAGVITLSNLLAHYTEITQVNAASSVETVTVGAGNHVILTGRGADLITTTGSTGVARIYSGAGADVIRAGGADLYIEAGAGADRVFSTAVKSEVWGWGKQAGESGVIGTDAGRPVDALAQADGADLLVGGAGNDDLHGQLGNDLLQGGIGNDSLSGGLGIDLMAGGTFAITKVVGGVAVYLANFNPATGFGGAINVSVLDAADGADSILGGLGSDIMIGGGGNDTVSGDQGADAVIGDFAIIRLSANLVAEAIETQFDSSAHAGTDSLSGGQGNDILIAGGSSVGSESITDLEGSNVVLGDFGKVSGARLSEAVTLIESRASAMGGADRITLGNGNDMALGGEGDDTITMGQGGDIVVADLGKIDISSRKVIGDGGAGNDVITFGSAGASDVADVLMAGLGDDSVNAGSGGLIMLGDEGTISLNTIGLAALRTYAPLGSVSTPAQVTADQAARRRIANMADSLVSANGAQDGNDGVTMADNGFLRAVMGGGDDLVELSDAVSYVLADDGTLTISTALVKLISAQSLNAGDDTVNSRAAADLIVGGAGNDSISLGAADDVVLTDGGTIQMATASGVVTFTMTTDALAYGNDTVSGDDGAKTLLLGLGDDQANLGDGGSLVLGDNGQATLLGGAWLANTTGSTGGADSITTGSGDDILLAGLGNDTVAAGDGANVILADTGSYTATKIESLSDANDGADSVTAGSGSDRVILGGGADVADLGDGDNLVLGDSGMILRSGAAVGSSADSIGGADRITTGAGNDVILAGAGSDSITAGAGNNALTGDAGQWSPDDLTSAHTAGDGDDTVTAGTGLDRVILGGGADVADLGAGDNRVIGDSGVMDWTSSASESVEVTDTLIGGADSITTGGGNDIIFGAAGADTITANDGANIILGDAGKWTPADLTSRSNAADGADSVTSGAGKDRVILGGGADVADLGAGDNRVIGDSGVMTYTTALETAVITDNAIGGADSITTGTGSDMVIGAIGADTITASDGDNMILGDTGQILLPAAGPLFMQGHDSVNGGNDLITTGTGRDVILGGLLDDTITSGAGDDAVLGDLGSYQAAKGAADGILQSLATAIVLGQDSILTGDGDDMVIAGLGNDTVNAGTGEDMVMGDAAYVTFANTADINSILIANKTLGGKDLLITEGPVGDDIVFGQSGTDDIRTAGGDDLIVGDIATITLSQARDALAGQSAADRLIYLQGTDTVLGFDDTVTAGDGADVIFAGFGADKVDGQGAQDIIIGDSALLVRGWTLLSTGAIYEKFSIDSNFAYVTGGEDSLTGGDGADIMIGGLGPDLFMGNTEDDLLFSDAYAGIFNATFTNGFTGAPTAQRFLLTSNFAGPGAIDVVSEAQQDASIGNSLDAQAKSGLSELIDLSTVRAGAEAQQAAQSQNGNGGHDSLAAIFDILASQEVLQSVAQLLASGAGQDLISAALQSYLVNSGVLSQNIDPIQLELILNAIVAQLTKTAMGDLENADNSAMRLAAE